MIALTLPYPPTVNGLWVPIARGKLVKSAAYRTWITLAGWEAKASKPDKIKGPYKISLTVVPPDRRRRDADNILKAVSDLLVSLHIIEDDSLCRELHVYWNAEPQTDGQLVVYLSPAE